MTFAVVMELRELPEPTVDLVFPELTVNPVLPELTVQLVPGVLRALMAGQA